ncbi:Signal transduction histidine-protein kinase BarA [Labrenzia sp. THAF82]|uniref:ATP-binding response regulator n=1 Tax=Labrenzia sp. THAF82 TaxID=2587861 RepID=UPI0012697C5A|nr:ATP-binding protein [Labrenzia sp. THAF82]QFT34569.1 Signal transduction histidine-protein kinase BarA [Labrenzia sp. THAF82]
MSLSDIDDAARLKKINAALVDRVEQAMDQQRNAFSLFQTAISLEGQIRRRTDELTSALRRLEETNIELARQKDISERANRSKTEFLAAASHDILQPLNAAQLTISSLHDLQVSDQARAMVNQVERSLDTMNELLRTLLDISRLDAGVTTPRFTSVPIPPILDSLLSDLRPIAEKKGLRLRVAVTNDCVYTDRLMLRRALQNLIANAIRYTNSGGVLIGTRRRGDEISIEVVDTGSGIPEDQLEKIFEEFHRGPLSRGDANADTGTGLGLGLAIVRRLVTALKHDVSVRSNPGHGSVFRIRAKRSEAPAEPAGAERTKLIATPVNASLKGKKILVIENDPAVLEAMEGLLSTWGCIYKIARSCDQAVAAVDAAAWVPDLIVADHHLDFGDLGTSTLEKLFELLPSRVPAILATADASQGVIDRARELGVEHLTKPVKPAQLRALATHLINKAG